MIPRVATVITPAWWEPAFVGWARRTAAARVMARCLHPVDVERVVPLLDSLAVGSSCPWLTPEAVGRWRGGGLRVVGVVEDGDRAGGRLTGLGCDAVVPDHPEAVATEMLGANRHGAPALRPTWVVTGPRGAPGRTEIAVGIASLLADHRPTTLIEADVDAPSLGLRLGLPPEAGPPAPHRWQGFGVLCLSPSTMPGDLDRLVGGLGGQIVVDAGPSPLSVRRWLPDHVVIVVEPSPPSVVRAAALIARLVDLHPWILANRAGADEARWVADILEREVWAVPADGPIEWGGPPSDAIRGALTGAVRRWAGPSGSSPRTEGRPG